VNCEFEILQKLLAWISIDTMIKVEG